MSYQFIHIESYAREGSVQKNKTTGEVKKTRSLREITDEAERKPGATPHIEVTQSPKLLYGCMPGEAADMAQAWADQATDAKGRKYRKDGLALLAGVISLPNDRADADEFFDKSIKWLGKKYGGRLKSVVAHYDETYPHIHFYVVPQKGERFEDIHQGVKSSNEKKAEGKVKGEQNRAYIEAMRAYQDEFSNEVAIGFGLTRLGPKRRRLTRAQWNAEKKQAEYFVKQTELLARSKEIAQGAYDIGYKKGKEKAKAEAKAIIAKAKEEANAIKEKANAIRGEKIKKWSDFGEKTGDFLANSLLLGNHWKKPSPETQKHIDDLEEKLRKETMEKKQAVTRQIALDDDLRVERKKVADLVRELFEADEEKKQFVKAVRYYENLAMSKGFKPYVPR